MQKTKPQKEGWEKECEDCQSIGWDGKTFTCSDCGKDYGKYFLEDKAPELPEEFERFISRYAAVVRGEQEMKLLGEIHEDLKDDQEILVWKNNLKSFISNLLASQRQATIQEVVRVLVRMKREEEDIVSIPQSMKVMQDVGFNEALTTAIEKVKKL